MAELVKLKCTGFNSVEKILFDFQRLCRILVEASEPMAEAMELELLLKQLMRVKPLSATLAMFAALPGKDQIRTTLIEWVEKLVEQDQTMSGKAAAAEGAGGGRGGGGAGGGRGEEKGVGKGKDRGGDKGNGPGGGCQQQKGDGGKTPGGGQGAG